MTTLVLSLGSLLSLSIAFGAFVLLGLYLGGF